MTLLATVAELQARCDWEFDDDEQRVAEGYLEEASDLARSYGRETWEAGNCPRMVKSIVISAVRRFMRNPDGVTVTRAGDETLGWADDPLAGTIHFSRNEQKLLRSLAGSAGIQTAGIVGWGSRPGASEAGRTSIAVSGWPGEKPFPYFSDPVEPW